MRGKIAAETGVEKQTYSPRGQEPSFPSPPHLTFPSKGANVGQATIGRHRALFFTIRHLQLPQGSANEENTGCPKRIFGAFAQQIERH